MTFSSVPLLEVEPADGAGPLLAEAAETAEAGEPDPAVLVWPVGSLAVIGSNSLSRSSVSERAETESGSENAPGKLTGAGDLVWGRTPFAAFAFVLAVCPRAVHHETHRINPSDKTRRTSVPRSTSGCGCMRHRSAPGPAGARRPSRHHAAPSQQVTGIPRLASLARGVN